MWEQLTRADMERVRHRWALERGAMLARHAAELKALDDEQNDLEILENVAAAFIKKYVPSAAQESSSKELDLAPEKGGEDPIPESRQGIGIRLFPRRFATR